MNLRLIQEYLGHRFPKTICIYTHLIPQAHAFAQKTINAIMDGLS